MGLTTYPYNSSNELAMATVQGINILPFGDFYQQYGATTAIANTTTETSLLNPASTAQFQGVTRNPSVTTSVIPVLPANSLTAGLILRGRIVGTIANTGTPNLQIRVVLKNTAGTVVYALADSTAVAMSTVSTSDFEVNFDCVVKTAGSSGSVYSRVNHRYATTTVYTAGAAVTVDTTAQYSLDVLLTWGAQSSSNTCTAQWAHFEAR